MEFPQKLYELRKTKGLSQEALAQELDVSRQAVSKWESGTAMPETDKLIRISTYFNVSMDELITGKSAVTMEKVKPGVVLCLLGAAGMIIWTALSLCMKNVSQQMATSSAVTIDGNGLFLIACVICMAVGAWLLIGKDPWKKQR